MRGREAGSEVIAPAKEESGQACEKVRSVADTRVVSGGLRVGAAEIEERFLDCVSRRSAQSQRRGTLRSE
jgi:hypothetical protein